MAELSTPHHTASPPSSSIELTAIPHISHPSSLVQNAGTDISVSLPDTRQTICVTPTAKTLHDKFITSSPSWYERLQQIIMSRTPLYIRSSPALGTGSYGAAPITEPCSDPDDSPGQRYSRSRRRSAQLSRTISSEDEGFTLSRRRTTSSDYRRRRSANATELSLGLDAKTSFAVPGEIAGQEPFSSGESSKSYDSSFDAQDGAEPESDSENSPYPEVRASVPNTDNLTLSINTPRMWTLSILFAVIGSGSNLFFSLRYPSVTISPVIALVLVHPLGRLWDLMLKRTGDPETHYIDGGRQSSGNNHHLSRITQSRLWLAQGSWNEKEHACVYISSNVSFGFAFATDVIVEQYKFYKQDAPIVYQILLTISTQILGYAFAGLTRRFLVRPAAMIWPGTLMSTAMFTTMHKNENKPANGWTISRYRFFVFVWLGAFLWYFVPGLLMPALSHFNVVTWFAPDNAVVANFFGVSSGLGLLPLTFDWAQIAYIGSPLLTPWWAAVNVVTGLALVMWVIAPILYYSNTFFSAYMPIVAASVFDNTGKIYDVSKILTPDFLFDKDAYENYSRVYLPITYVLSYAVQFAALSALVSHTTCWHGKDIWRQTQDAFKERNEKAEEVGYQSIPQSNHNDAHSSSISISPFTEDIHCKLMQRYSDVPMFWYLITFVAMLAIGIFVVEYYPTHLPWYGLILAVGITAIFFIPVGIVMAITNQHSSLYFLTQLICGVVFPGRPMANMVFVTYSYISSAQGVKFSSDMKLGHYMKIPPKILFLVQMIATLVSSFVQIGVLNWAFRYIPGVCTPQALNGFSCPLARVHFNGSILWGLVGPQRFFGTDALYHPLVWAFLIGLIAPVLVWYMGKDKKRSLWRKVNLPVLFGSLSWIPPATGLNFSVWAVVCFTFNYVIRRRASAWWGKYTMNMSAALDSALAFGVVVAFFGFIYPGVTANFKWWGTEIYKHGCDWLACPYIKLDPGERFGP